MLRGTALVAATTVALVCAGGCACARGASVPTNKSNWEAPRPDAETKRGIARPRHQGRRHAGRQGARLRVESRLRAESRVRVERRVHVERRRRGLPSERGLHVAMIAGAAAEILPRNQPAPQIATAPAAAADVAPNDDRPARLAMAAADAHDVPAPASLHPDPIRPTDGNWRSSVFGRYEQSLVKPVGNCQEFATVDPRVRRIANDAAAHFGSPALATSCYRSLAYNRAVYHNRCRRGGCVGDGSQHILHRALDFKILGVAAFRLAAWVRQHPLMRTIGGVGLYCGDFIHVDVGERRNWNWCGDKQADGTRKLGHRYAAKDKPKLKRRDYAADDSHATRHRRPAVAAVPRVKHRGRAAVDAHNTLI